MSKLVLFQNLVYSEQFDIVCVCETWLHEGVLDNEILQNYTIYRNDRLNNRGGGVLVAIKSDLRSIRRNHLEGTNCEQVMVEVFPLGRPKLFIGVFYRPPNDNIDSLLELRSSLDKLDESCRLILVGDFNLPKIDWSHDYPTPASNNNQNEELFCEIIADNFLSDLVTGPTHIQGNKLDCLLCNHASMISNVTCTQPHNIFPTDHYLINFEINICCNRAKPVKRSVYDYKSADFPGLRTHLNYAPLDLAISEKSDINECWQNWKDLFLTSVEEFVPKKTVSDKNTPPWIDREVKYLIKKKYTALRRYRLNQTQQRKENLRRLTQEVKDMIKRKHEDYLASIKHSFADNPKLFWSYHKAIHSNKQQSTIITHGDIIATTNREKVNLFNSYFSAGFQPKSDRTCFEFSDASETVMQISEIQLETNEVYECLRTLHTTKACGPDEIPARILKECASEISPSLRSLFNTSLKVGKVPDEWKKSNVTPVHKKDSRENVSNYRPISLLSIISKVMERCIHNRVYPILSALINKTQHGFLKKRSCVTQLLSVLHDIGKNLDNNKQVDMIYLDFAKAFDSVDHAILYHLHRKLLFTRTTQKYIDLLHLWLTLWPYNKT